MGGGAGVWGGGSCFFRSFHNFWCASPGFARWQSCVCPNEHCLPLSFRIFLNLIFFFDSMFARSLAKSQSQNEGSGSNAPAPPSAVPDNATAEELKALLDRQRLEMEGLRARLEAQKIAVQAVVRELNEATPQEFQGRERLPHWMRDTLGALRQYVVAVPRPARPAG